MKKNIPYAERLDTSFGAYCNSYDRLDDIRKRNKITGFSGPEYTKNILIHSLTGTLLFSAFFGIPLGLLKYNEFQKQNTDETILSDNNIDENNGIYEIGKHSVVAKSTKEELTNTVNNIPTWYDLEKIEKLENNEYDVYFINNTKVVVTKDNKFGIEIEDAKVKTK